MADEQIKVLIIGAGLGGLALAQILRGQNIPFEIFERDAQAHTRSQGWAVGLVECLSDLAELLPKDLDSLDTLSVNYEAKCGDNFVLLDPQGNEMASLGGAKPGEPGYVLRASRSRARDLLWQNLDVRMGKIFSHYEQDRHGVTAFFKDGTSARGSILVGADGAHSRVRHQLLGDTYQLVQSKHVPIIGECTLPRHLYEPLHQLGSAGILVSGPEMRYMVGLRSIKADLSSADYYFSGSRVSSDPEADNAWAQAASKRSLYNRALEITAHLPSWLTDIIRYTGEAGMLTPPLRFVEFVPPTALPRGRVTLLGDAGHTMVPFRGQGANCALLDACDLARQLTQAVNDASASASTSPSSADSAIPWLLQAYEDSMLPRGRRLVLTSRAAGDGQDGALGALQGRNVVIRGKRAQVSEQGEVVEPTAV